MGWRDAYVDLIAEEEGLAALPIDLDAQPPDLKVGIFHFLAGGSRRTWWESINPPFCESEL